MHTKLALVGDIGGQHAQLALLDNGGIKKESIRSFDTTDFPSLEALLDRYLSEQDVIIHKACLGISDTITNNHWTPDKEALSERFQLDVCDIQDRFALHAYGISSLQDSERLPVGPELEASAFCPKLIICPEKTLKIATLIETSTGWRALLSEGGHVNFCPANERDIHLWRFLKNRRRGTGYDRILSVTGLELLYEAHARMASEKELLTAPEIIRKAKTEPMSVSFEVVEHFCELLGHFAGNAALMTGARGGVFITGELAPKIRDIFQKGAFRHAFEKRDKVPEYAKSTPSWLVLANHMELKGAATLLNAGKYL